MSLAMTIQDLNSEIKLSIETQIAMQIEVEAPVVYAKRPFRIPSNATVVTTKKPRAELGNKVKQLIKILANLKEEMTEEADHESFCDMRLATNKQTRDLKTKESDGLIAESEKLPRTPSNSPRM